jgi:nitrogenase molybdenum-iron protein NifN
LAIVEQLAAGAEKNAQVNVFTPMSATPSDIRFLRRLFQDFGLTPAIIPDFSDTLDGGNWDEYERIPKGGTPLSTVVAAGGALASISLEEDNRKLHGPGEYLSNKFGVANYNVGLPIGLNATDKLFEALEKVSVRSCPEDETKERGRLVDAMIDAHKILFEKRVAIIGEAPFVCGIASLCCELGLSPVLCATGSNRGRLETQLRQITNKECFILDDTDHSSIHEAAKDLKLDVVLGPSKVRSWARALNVPVVCVGFPIHDRFGAARIRTFGYSGALQLLDRIANAILERRQEEAGLGWAYL